VPEKLAKTNRVPSYKQIAITILRNDFAMKGLGFEGRQSEVYRQIRASEKAKESTQRSLPL